MATGSHIIQYYSKDKQSKKCYFIKVTYRSILYGRLSEIKLYIERT